MTTPENDKSEEYERYAAYCLKAAARLSDQNHDAFTAKWPPEWLRPAEAIQTPGLRLLGESLHLRLH